MYEIAYAVSLIAPNNKLYVKCLVDHIWYHYSNLSIAVAGFDIGFDFGLFLWGGGDCFDEMKRYVA